MMTVVWSKTTKSRFYSMLYHIEYSWIHLFHSIHKSPFDHWYRENQQDIVAC